MRREELLARAGERIYRLARRAGRLPPWILIPTARRAALLALRGRALRRACHQVGIAFPDWQAERRTAAARAAAAFRGEVWADLLRLSSLHEDQRMARFDVSALEDAVRGGLEARTGAVVVTGHLGHWEGLAAALAAASGDVMIVSRRLHASWIQDLLERFRRSSGVRSCSYFYALLDAARWLKRNRVVVVVADGDARREGVFLPFLGRAASVAPAATQLAAMSGSPLIASLCTRQDGAWRASQDGTWRASQDGTWRASQDGTWRASAEVLPLPRFAGPELQRDALLRWLAILEAGVRRHPEQYLWTHRRWRTRPARGAGAEAELPVILTEAP